MLFLPKFSPFGPKMGKGGFFQKSVLFTFLHFWIPNFMSNFKKIVRAVFWVEFFLKNSQVPTAHFLHVKAQKMINYRAPLYTIFVVSILVLIIQNLTKIVRAVFSQIANKCYFGPNLLLLGPKWGRGDFFFKNLLRSLFIISGFPISC